MGIDMTGKAVIVTGGGKGVGRGISERFLASGADVTIGGLVTLTELSSNALLGSGLTAIAEAAASVGTPHHQEAGV